MGRPKVKFIDDSQPEEPKKEASEEKKEAKVTGRSFGGKKGGDSLVESLKAELGIQEEPKKEVSKEEKVSKVSKVEEKTETKKEAAPAPAAPKKAAKVAQKTKPRSKKYLEAIKTLEDELKQKTPDLPDSPDTPYSYKQSTYKLAEAIDMVKKLSYAKFDVTLEAHINTTQTGIRGLVSLPYASGKKIRILAFGKGAEQSGADIFGDESTLDEISKGKINFDIVITTPDWMPKLAKVAKFLGPRGLMPNPKNGTITDDLKKAAESFQAGKTEYKTEAKGKVIHLGLGKLTQPNEELVANIKMLFQTVGKTRISKVTLSPTMGAGVKVDLNSI